jgi:hypothetical protein
VLSQVLSKKQHPRDLHVAFPTDMKFVRPNAGHLAFEEMMARGQVASTSIAQLSKRPAPLFNRAGNNDHSKYVDFAFRGQFGYGGAPNVMHFQ